MKKVIALTITALITGCAGLDNPCNDQGPGKCASVTTAYQNSLKSTINPADLPRGQSVADYNNSNSAAVDNDLVVAYTKQQSYSQIPKAGDALRSSPKSMRVWILPYEDNLGLYHDQQYVYALVEKGAWKYKSVSLKNNSNQYMNTFTDNSVSGKSYQPFAAKESDPIANNQSLISSVGTPGSTNAGAGGSPFTAQAIANKNASIINSVSSGTPLPSGN